MGSQAHDELFWSEERGYRRETNRAGGVEGGMTTGDPVVVRGAMKPLPTLTKPLRSVDIATKEPAQALRERTDSCTVPAAGVVGEAMVALVLASAYREKLGGDHIDDVRARARRLPRADRMEAGVAAGQAPPARASSVRSCSSASWAPASPPRRARRPPSWAWRRSTPTGSSSAGSASRSRTFFDREGEAAFRAREEEVVLELLAGARTRGRGRARRRRACGSERVREALRAHTVVQLEVDPEDAWRRASGNGRPLARDQARFEQLHRDREPLYASVADAVAPSRRPRRRSARRCPRSRALAEAPAGHAARLGRLRLGRLPGLLRTRA